MALLLLLPLFFFVCTTLLFYRSRRVQASYGNWRVSCLLAAIACGVQIVISTELLSLGHAMHFTGVVGWWTFSALAVGGLLLYKIQKSKFPSFSPRIPVGTPEKVLLGCFLLVIATLAVIALVAAPNNWDSMTYHLTRVRHWMQHESVAHYPTHVMWHLYHSPLAEFCSMHLMILTGGDYFVNFVQWFSMVGSCIGVSLIAGNLGATHRGQIYAALACVTIPMGILQATSTQNDYAAAFWFVCFTYFLLRFLDAPTPLLAVLMGVGAGLGTLAKPTIYVYAVPFLLWLAIFVIRRQRKSMFQYGLLFSVAFLLMNAGHYIRNMGLAGKPLGIPEGSPDDFFENESLEIGYLAGNIIRNVSLHLTTPFRSWNKFFNNVCNELYYLLNASGSSINTLATRFDEDYAGNVVHLFMIFIAVSLLWLNSHVFPRKRKIYVYAFCLTAAFVLLCLYLKWLPTSSRLHTALFVLFSAVTGVVFEKTLWTWAARTLMVLFLAQSFFFITGNATRPLLGGRTIFNVPRLEQYFWKRPELLPTYVEAAATIQKSGCNDIGLILPWDHWEYPLFLLLDDNKRIRHVAVKNASARYYAQEPEPCLVVTIDNNKNVIRVRGGSPGENR